MKTAERKAAIAAYKERKQPMGIYSVRCEAAGLAWVGRSLSLDTVRNRLWFGLGFGNSPHRSMQRAWNEHGADSLTFSILQQVPEDHPVYLRDEWLKSRQADWCERLGAEAI